MSMWQDAFQLFSFLAFYSGLPESALPCKKGCLSQLGCGQDCLGRRESVLFSCRPALSKQNREGKQSQRGWPRQNASECPTESQEAVDEGHTVTHPWLSAESGLEDEKSF